MLEIKLDHNQWEETKYIPIDLLLLQCTGDDLTTDDYSNETVIDLGEAGQQFCLESVGIYCDEDKHTIRVMGQDVKCTNFSENDNEKIWNWLSQFD